MGYGVFRDDLSFNGEDRLGDVGPYLFFSFSFLSSRGEKMIRVVVIVPSGVSGTTKKEVHSNPYLLGWRGS